MLFETFTASSNIFQGIVVILIGAFCFGTLYVPIKRCTLQRDAIFVQWIMSLGSLFVGFAVNTAVGCPRMHLLATAGGALWTVANTTAQFVITSLGLAVALLLWNTTSVLTGWAAGRFGLFGLKQKVPEHPTLNLVGLCVVITGGIFFAFVKRGPPTAREQGQEQCSFHIPKLSIGERRRKKGGTQHTVEHHSSGNNDDGKPVDSGENCSTIKAVAKWKGGRRVASVLLALLAGFFYAATVIPVLYIQDNLDKFPGAPSNGLSYIFSHYFGVFLASSTIFVSYALAKGNRPSMCATEILPSLASGAIWGCAMACLFLANDLLTQTVTYPVMITIPGCIASIWSIFYFKEINMSRYNLIPLSAAFLLIFTGAALVLLSKIKF